MDTFYYVTHPTEYLRWKLVREKVLAWDITKVQRLAFYFIFVLF